MANEANEHTFSFNEIGDDTGEKFIGDFTSKKRLSHRDQLRLDQIRRDLLGSQPGMPTPRAISTAMILANLAVRIIKAPKWWAEVGEGLDLQDDNIIGKLDDLVMAPVNAAEEAKAKAATKAREEMRAEAAKKEAEEAAIPAQPAAK